MIYIAFLLFTFLIIAFVFYQSQHLIFFTPTHFREGEFGSSCEILSVTTDDGVELEGVSYEPSNAKSTILFFGGIEHDSVGLIDRLSSEFKNSRIITFNYRSYGRSEGKVSEKNMLSDALKVAQIVQKNYGDFYILGFSIGASVAASVASKHKSLGVFLIGAFDSTTSLARARYGIVVSWILRYKFDNIKFVQNLEAPVYMFSSKSDEVVYIQNARILKNSIRNMAFYKEFDNLSHKELLWSHEVINKINGVVS
jgi:uncharacterized protein